jgi:hypothetical protein
MVKLKVVLREQWDWRNLPGWVLDWADAQIRTEWRHVFDFWQGDDDTYVIYIKGAVLPAVICFRDDAELMYEARQRK